MLGLTHARRNFCRSVKISCISGVDLIFRPREKLTVNLHKRLVVFFGLLGYLVIG